MCCYFICSCSFALLFYYTPPQIHLIHNSRCVFFRIVCNYSLVHMICIEANNSAQISVTDLTIKPETHIILILLRQHTHTLNDTPTQRNLHISRDLHLTTIPHAANSNNLRTFWSSFGNQAILSQCSNITYENRVSRSSTHTHTNLNFLMAQKCSFVRSLFFVNAVCQFAPTCNTDSREILAKSAS